MIAGVVLAAGGGTRIGHPKALLCVGGARETFVERAWRVLHDAGIPDIIVVTAPETAASVRRLVPAARVVINEEPLGGQTSSLRRGIGAVSTDTEAIALLPVDVPLVRVETIAALLGVWRRERPAVVRPAGGGRHGHPVILSRSLFAELMTASETEGARPIVRRHATADGDVPTDDPGAFTDIDTVEDYQEAFGLPVRVLREPS